MSGEVLPAGTPPKSDRDLGGPGEETRAMPGVVAALAYGGALPFMLLAPALAFDEVRAALWSSALSAYGGVILSFVGALHWGIAMRAGELGPAERCQCYVWSVTPALLAWVAQLLAASLAGAPMAAGFAAHYLQDRRLARRAIQPPWYMPLRTHLSLVAVASMTALALLG